MHKLEIDHVTFQSADPVLTGRQILTLAGKHPVEEYLVYYLGPDRQLEDIDLEETIDLREPGRERFVVSCAAICLWRLRNSVFSGTFFFFGFAAVFAFATNPP